MGGQGSVPGGRGSRRHTPPSPVSDVDQEGADRGQETRPDKVPTVCLAPCRGLSSLPSQPSLRGRHSNRFKDEATEAQRTEATWPESHSWRESDQAGRVEEAQATGEHPPPRLVSTLCAPLGAPWHPPS